MGSVNRVGGVGSELLSAILLLMLRADGIV